MPSVALTYLKVKNTGQTQYSWHISGQYEVELL